MTEKKKKSIWKILLYILVFLIIMFSFWAYILSHFGKKDGESNNFFLKIEKSTSHTSEKVSE